MGLRSAASVVGPVVAAIIAITALTPPAALAGPFKGCDAEAIWDKANLAGCDLSGANLSGANLGGAIMSGANLKGANLASADMGIATLTGANLTSAKMTGAILWGAALSDASLGFANLSGADLRFANLSGAALWFANLPDANLSDANLSRAILSYTDLTRADLTRADLTGVRSGGISGLPAGLPADWKLISSYLIGPGADLSGAILSNADLSGANLSGANLSGAFLSDTDLSGSDLAGVRSGGITGTPSNLPVKWKLINGYLIGPGADLEGADLEGADLSDADLEGARLGSSSRPAWLPEGWVVDTGGSIRRGDSSAPGLPMSFTGVPKGLTKETFASVGFSLAEVGGTIECRLDSGFWGACTSHDAADMKGTFVVTGLADGAHAVSVRHSDADGNTSDLATTASWTVDATPPGKASGFSGVPSGVTKTTSVTVGFALSETGGSVQCRLDSEAWGTCSSHNGSTKTATHTVNALADGSHTISARHIDDAGNISEVATTNAWSVDTVPPPSPTLVTKPARFTNLNSAAFSWIAPPVGVTVRCVLTGEAPAACTSPRSLRVVTAGEQTFAITFTDRAGNSATTAHRWTVDRTVPVLTSRTKTKIATATNYTITTQPEPSGITQAEFSTATRKPSAAATNAPARTADATKHLTLPNTWKTTFNTRSTIRWIRIKDAAGNWSDWSAG